jgi:DNA-binding SARP family transcriptional activator/predicted negative regulator of RcsB-dependent stress response
MAVSIRLLGPPRVERDGAAVSFDTRKAVALLAHLALSDRPRSRDALCDLLWPAQDSERARGALRRTLSTLRGAIGEEWVETQADGVALLRGDDLEIDVERFRALAEDDDAQVLAEAADLCAGALLEGFALRDSPQFEQWQMAEARGLAGELAQVLQRLVGMLAAGGDYAGAIRYARRWLDAEPLHEMAHRELIRLYALSGDRAAALEQYRECVRALTQELGVAPVEETSLLFEQVSEGRVVAEPVRPERPAATVPASPSAGDLPLVGRTGELARLAEMLDSVDGSGRLAVIEGEAGIGKTRLAAELTAHARAADALVLTARCHDASPELPYAPILELLTQALATAPDWIESVGPQRLADVSLLVPELGELRELPPPLSVSGPVAQARLLEGVAAVLAAATQRAPKALVFVDDVHAADSATLDVLAYLAQRLRRWPALLVMCWRSEHVPAGDRLRRLAGDLTRADAGITIRLERLSEAEVTELVTGADPEAPTELAERIYVESEGLPLFVTEYLEARPSGEGPLTPFPREVRSLLEARLSGLDPISLQVVGAGAVIGRDFDFDVVRSTSGRDFEETLDAIEELLAKGLLREVGEGGAEYEFSHQKLRELIYEEVSPPRRRLLHLRAARAIPATPARAALIARHLREGGEEREAAEQYRAAAAHAVGVHAHADALGYLQAALACDPSQAGDLHEWIGDLQLRLGNYGAARSSYEAAAAEAAGASLAALEHKLGLVHLRRGEWDRADGRLTAALGTAPPEAPGLRARIAADLALTMHSRGGVDGARRQAEEALALAEEAGDQRALTQAHNLVGMLARSEGDLDAAGEELAQSRRLAEELEDEPAQVAALNNLALVARDAGRLDEALELTTKALEACSAYGDRHREAALENNLADLHHEAGRRDEAMAHLKRAVAIFAEVGGDEATRLPEIWKLVSW